MNAEDIVKFIEIPIVAGFIGVIIGAIGSLFSGLITEELKYRKIRKRTKKLVKAELETYKNFMNSLLTSGRRNNGVMIFDFGTPMITTIKLMMPENQLHPEIYPNLPADVKTMAFDVKVAIALTYTYKLIGYFWMKQDNNGFFIAKKDVDELLDQIKKTICLL